MAAVGVALALPGTSASALPGSRPKPRTPAVVAAGKSVPAGYRANSISWLTPKRGWVLGSAPCGQKTCSDVLATTSRGKTWNLAGAVPAPISTVGEPSNPGITDIRFATSTVGWAFGPKLFQTTDGGASWASMTIPGNGRQVLSLATSSKTAYAVVSACRYAEGLCGQPLTFWRTTTLAGGPWTQVKMRLPVAISADVAVLDKSVYVIDSQSDGGTDRFYASTDGRHFSTRPVPCDNAKGVGLIQAVPMSASRVALLCEAPIGFGKAYKKVYRSTDNAETDRSAGVLGMYGIQTQLAASASGNLAVASSSIGSFMYVNDGGKAWAMPIGFSDGGAGWNDIVYTTNRTAWVVYAPAGFFNGVGRLAVTHDAGRTWAISPF
ncbi:MAG: hypothetical protein QOI06_3523 [Nocardioidaceae bacterium]|nr:hypothetical protein [Nocardioidaceae bacterium]